MRIPALVVLFLVLANAGASAQGLEYRVRMHMTMPGMEGVMPTPETTMYMEDGKIRVDNSTRGTSMSIIMDVTGRRMYYLNHTDKTYREEKPFEKLAERMANKDMVPDVITTSDTRTLLGFAARRFIMVMRIPVPAEPGRVMLSINESWIATDPQLNEAFESSMELAERILGPVAREMRATMPPGAEGVPLESTILMLQRNAADPVDAVALLKDPNPPGLMTRARMETLSVKLQNLPDSLFAVPADYRKAN